MSQWTTLDLLATIKNRAMLPDASSGSLGTATLLNFATEELHSTILPMIASAREKYYETYVDTVITATTTALVIPYRAVGSALTAVQYIYGTDVRQMLPIDPCSVTTTQSSSYPTNYYFQNNAIIPYPLPSSAQGTIRMRYLQRPNRLEQTVNCAQITSFTPTTVTCNALPSAWVVTNTVDFIPKTQSQATPYGLDSVITNVSGTTLTFASVPAATAVGDWIALSEYTPIPEIPFEFQSSLAQAAACKALEAIKDTQGLQSATEKLSQTLKDAVKIMTPRDQNGPKKILSAWRRF